jgi:hypothetical protein
MMGRNKAERVVGWKNCASARLHCRRWLVLDGPAMREAGAKGMRIRNIDMPPRTID